MSIRNYIRGDDNNTLKLFCNHFNCGEVDIRNDNINNVITLNAVYINCSKLCIKKIDIEKYIKDNEQYKIDTNLKISNMENDIILLKDNNLKLQKVIMELTNINLIN